MTTKTQKTALITGAVGGIGTATVVLLRSGGYHVVACDRRSNLATDWLAKMPEEIRMGVDYHDLDVTDEAQVSELAGKLADEKVIVSYLVNNAGIQGPGAISEFSTKTWQRVINVNLGGTFNLTRAFSGGMIERGFGRIVNIASLFAYHPEVGQHSYASAKSAITGLTRSTALELAPHGITVNAVAPGWIFHEGILVVYDKATWQERMKDVPMKRSGKPEEIAATIEFLFSKGAAYITGQTVHVNGGSYLPA